MELLTKLGINWGLLLSQIVNFGIVFGALTLLVYKPLLNLLDARSEKIRKSMEDVKRIDAQKKEMEEFRLEQMRKVDEEVGKYLDRAKKEAEVTKNQIVAAAHDEAKRILEKSSKDLAEERTRVFSEVQTTLAQIIIRMTEKILSREFKADDQKRLLADLTKELPQKMR